MRDLLSVLTECPLLGSKCPWSTNTILCTLQYTVEANKLDNLASAIGLVYLVLIHADSLWLVGQCTSLLTLNDWLPAHVGHLWVTLHPNGTHSSDFPHTCPEICPEYPTSCLISDIGHWHIFTWLLNSVLMGEAGVGGYLEGASVEWDLGGGEE